MSRSPRQKTPGATPRATPGATGATPGATPRSTPGATGATPRFPTPRATARSSDNRRSPFAAESDEEEYLGEFWGGSMLARDFEKEKSAKKVKAVAEIDAGKRPDKDSKEFTPMSKYSGGKNVAKADKYKIGREMKELLIEKRGDDTRRVKKIGKGGGTRLRTVIRDNIQGITKPAIRRLARRGGVKRISGLIYDETRTVLKQFLNNVLRDAVTYCEHAKRRTVRPLDVVFALKRHGRALYGYGA